jgi:F-type H+-transporting ATPase subunit epsilon
MNVFELEIINPQGNLYKGQVRQVIVPAVEGDMGILAFHISIVSALVAGNIEIDEGNEAKQILPISGGYLKFSDNKCTILCD